MPLRKMTMNYKRALGTYHHMDKKNDMFRIRKLPFWIDTIFCLILLPVMIMLLPIERWLVNNSGFVFILVVWLYIVYIINRTWTMPFLLHDKKRIVAAICLILLTVLITYMITHYQMDISAHRM